MLRNTFAEALEAWRAVDWKVRNDVVRIIECDASDAEKCACEPRDLCHKRAEGYRAALALLTAAAEPEASLSAPSTVQGSANSVANSAAEPEAPVALPEVTYCKTCFGTGKVEQDIPMGEVDVYPCPTCRR